jgi:hypothetical protein
MFYYLKDGYDKFYELNRIKTKLQSIMKSICTLALGFAMFMAVYACYDGQEFQLLKFILDGTLFGFFMFFVFSKNSKTKIKPSDKISKSR